MAYRFSDTSKWSDEWFIDLSAHGKLMFLYFCDNCDIAGFLELSRKKLCFDLSLSVEEIKEALVEIERGYILSSDKRILYIKNFIKHQKNLPINPENKAHMGILNRFTNYADRFDIDLLSLVTGTENKGASKGLKSPTGKGNGIGKGNTLELSYIKPEFEKIFTRWIDYKKQRKESYKTDESLKMAYQKLLRLSEEKPLVAVRIIEEAMASNYAGFFALKQGDMEQEIEKSSPKKMVY